MTPRYTIGHRVYTPDAVDDLGNEREAWEDPVDLKVFSVAPTASLADREPTEPSRDAVVTGLTALVPRSAELDPHDRFVLDDSWPRHMRGEWEQDGEVGDYSRGPFTNSVGHIVLNLKRTEG